MLEQHSLPEEPAIPQKLLSSGVIVVEIKQALRAQDFDALSTTADGWIQTRGSLNGLVLHAHHFPGWENLKGLVEHLRFARTHLAKIKRIALVTDAKAASVVEQLAEHFVKAEVRHFGYSSLDEAVAWAQGR
ncbi:MAG TPA: STAS/SEC14 domain-containing protein [Polyangiaceae bacterium]